MRFSIAAAAAFTLCVALGVNGLPAYDESRNNLQARQGRPVILIYLPNRADTPGKLNDALFVHRVSVGSFASPNN